MDSRRGLAAPAATQIRLPFCKQMAISLYTIILVRQYGSLAPAAEYKKTRTPISFNCIKISVMVYNGYIYEERV
jgi:hypothetical protein